MLLLLLGLLPANANPPEAAASDSAEVAPDPAIDARMRQLREEMAKLATKNAWKGVERVYQDMVALGVPVPAQEMYLAAEAARMRGDAWSAYQRLVPVIRDDPEHQDAHARMREYRESYGRVTVRRVDDSPIALSPAVMPFSPDQRAAVEFAAERLKETGGFDGMLPLGQYSLGPHALTVEASLKPVLVQRVAGDATGK